MRDVDSHVQWCKMVLGINPRAHMSDQEYQEFKDSLPQVPADWGRDSNMQTIVNKNMNTINNINTNQQTDSGNNEYGSDLRSTTKPLWFVYLIVGLTLLVVACIGAEYFTGGQFSVWVIEHGTMVYDWGTRFN